MRCGMESHSISGAYLLSPIGAENHAVFGKDGGVPGGGADAGRHAAHAAIGHRHQSATGVHRLEFAGVAGGYQRLALGRGRGWDELLRLGTGHRFTQARRMKFGGVVFISGRIKRPAFEAGGSGVAALGVLLSKDER